MKKLTLSILFMLSCAMLGKSQENNALFCSDGIDNDGDGLIDCEDGECLGLPNDGCTICMDGITFADTVLAYNPGCPHIDTEPEGALGVSDWTGGSVDEFQFVFLGQGGSIKLGFTDNVLVNSGDNQQDVFIFEVGPAVEPCEIALRPANAFTELQLINLGIADTNLDGFYSVGSIAGSVSGIDIDAIMPGYLERELQFDAIEIMDIDDNPCHNGTVGADIDAVCALSSLVVDCAGVVNGTSIIDACGECHDPSSPDFNQSCIDCAGIVNGTFLLDSCGICLQINDPNFSYSCTIERKVYIPNVFSPNNDGVNDRFRVFAADGVVDEILRYTIFDRWGELIYERTHFDLHSTTDWWNGQFRNKKMQPAVFVYVINVQFSDNTTKTYSGDVLLLH